MELKDLDGRHKLTGVEFGEIAGVDKYYPNDVSNYYAFQLDGVTYLAIEDPEDGYRSTMRDLRTRKKRPSTTFDPVDVIALHYDTWGAHSEWGRYQSDILTINDAATGKPIIIVGTEDVDDYYPLCIMEYHPEVLGLVTPEQDK